ncbi:hypothetical protein Scep_021655 [Stephania cephalantha]|uniref:Uncharacterized protein n=1 Tax=Stephania cephalantha TaxID=152367 RepID=A0AAP0F3U7_9MAGN
MVVAVAPGKFYGSSLPRPRFYDNSASDLHLNDERIDPPLPVTDPLLSWANEAHWSMGGLSFNRHRLQGKIEGSIKLLRAAEERGKRKAARNPNNKGKPLLGLVDSDTDSDEDADDDEQIPKPSPEIEVRRPLKRLRKGKGMKNGADTDIDDVESSPIRDASPENEITRPLKRLRRGKKTDMESSPIRHASPEIEVSRSMKRLKKKRSAIERSATDGKSSPVAAGFGNGVSTRARAKREGDDLENVYGKSGSVSPKPRSSPRIAKDKRFKD